MIKLIRLLTAFPALAAMVIAAPTSAADPASVDISVAPTGKLLDRTLVRVSTSFTCAPMEVASNQGSVLLEQAVSGKVAYGSGFGEQPIVCDGTAHVVSYLIWVATASPAPFRQGNATVQVTAFLCPPTPTPISSCQSGSSGIQVIRLKK